MSKYKKEELEELILVQNLTYDKIGEMYGGVTGAAIRKAANRLGIELPKRRKINSSETFNKGKRKEGKKFCATCEKLLISGQNKYCSRECHREHEYKKYIERWISKEVTGIKGKDQISRYVVRYIKEKYGNKCQLCNWCEINPTSGNIPLQLHHIDGDALNNSEDNLQLLCPNCHSLTDNYGNLNKKSTRVSLKELRKTTKTLREG